MPIINGQHRWHTACAADAHLSIPDRLRAFLLDFAEIVQDVETLGFTLDQAYIGAASVLGFPLVGAYSELLGDFEDPCQDLGLDAFQGFARALCCMLHLSVQQHVYVQESWDWVERL